MATITSVNRGTVAGDGTGEILYDAFGKVNANDTALNNQLIASISFNTSNGVLTLTKEDASTYTVDLDGRYLQSETSHADVLVDGDFTSQGIMLRGATSGSYSILTDNSANWNTAFSWGDHAGLYDSVGSAAAVASDLSTHEGLTTGVHGSTSASTASTIVERNGSGDINCRLVRPTFANQSSISGAMAYRVNDTADNYIRFCSDIQAIRTFLDVDPAGTVNYTHPSYTARTESADTGPLTGATVISDLDFNISSDSSGHITACDITTVATRDLTAGDIGAATSSHTHSNYIDSTASDTASGATYTWSNGSVSHIFDGSGNSAQCRITRNDGGGNWNFRAGHYYSGGDKFSNTGAGAALIRIDTDSAGGVMFLRTAETGTADTTITWDANIQFDNTAFDSDVQMEAPAFVTDGGTSSQFVKGDGSLDSTTYWSSHADTSTLNGNYGSTANGTKIDVITVDDNGHITAVTTGATGTVTSVSAGSGMSFTTITGSGSVAIDTTMTAITSMYNTSLQVGYSSTTAFIDFNSTAMDFEWSSAPEFRMTSTGNFHADADITAYSSTTTSDRRYKKDIEVIPNALDKINTLNGVTFKWKRDDKKSAGLIAQDVEKVLPQAVCVKEALKTGEEYLALNYDCVVGMLVEAVKELTARVEKLENGKH